MDLLVPLEVGRDGEFYAQRRSSDWLDVHGEVEFGDLMEVFVQHLAGLWHANQLAHFVRSQIEHALKGEVLLL